MSPYCKKLIQGAAIVGGCILAIVVLSFTVPIISDKFGPSEALAQTDNTREIMATCLTDAKELWIAIAEPRGGLSDGDKIAITNVAAKLFEARYLLTYIE